MRDQPAGAISMFITLEGTEGTGKSTQIRLLGQSLRARGQEVVETKEPGGTSIGDRLRAIVLDTRSTMDAVTEVLLFAASRRQHVMEVIKPALQRGAIVLCDRYADSTLAYQGFGRLLDLDRLRALNDWATDGVEPDLTLLLDLPEALGLERAQKRITATDSPEGRFEAEEIRFHRRVREGYRSLALAGPHRWVTVSAEGTAEEVQQRIMESIAERMRGEP